jgi:DNA-binding CsgD family transcriptional regulator
VTEPRTVEEAEETVGRLLGEIDEAIHNALGQLGKVSRQLDAVNERIGTLSAIRSQLARTQREQVRRTTLTQTELQVAWQYAWSELTTTEIARQRYVSVNTVKSHLKAAYKVLGVHDREGLREALRTAGRPTVNAGRWAPRQRGNNARS